MKKKIFVRGPVLSQSGYGEQSRFALRALRSREDIFEIYIQPINWGHTGWQWEDNEFRQWMDERIAHTQVLLNEKKLSPDMSLQITIPNEFEKICPINIGYTAGIETDRVAPVWLEKANIMDKVLVVSNHAKIVYEGTQVSGTHKETGQKMELKLNTEIEVVHESTVQADPEPLDTLDPPTDFNFLVVSQAGPRKNFANTIQWWVEEFIDQEVGLIVKTNTACNSRIDREHTEKQLARLLNNYPDRKCKVYLLHGDLSSGQMTSLYTNPKVKALINIAHGEGFGLPLFEAAREALPIITMKWSGQQDFLVYNKKEYFQSVKYSIADIDPSVEWENVLVKGSKWAYADQGSYKMTLRRVYKNWDKAKKKAEELQELLKSNFSDEKLYANFVKQIYDDPTAAVAVEDIPKISLVTSVYKAEKHIEQLMEDITRQTVFNNNCEWMIYNVDPEGNNESEEVILKYVEKYPNNIVYKRLKKDPGVYGVWNNAIKDSTGQFITNVNCDDRRAPYALEKQAKMLVANPDVSLVYNDSYLTREPNLQWENIDKGKTERYNFEQFSKEALLRSNLPHNNPMWRRDIHEAHGYFDEEYKSAGDWDFWLRCAFAGCEFKKCDEPLGVYYFNPEGISTNVENNSWKQEEERKVYKTYRTKLQQQMFEGPIL